MAASVAFIADVTTALGGNLIDVELTQEDFDYALAQAIRVWQQRGNNNLDKKFLPISIVTDTKVYDLSTELPGETIDTIVRIIKSRSTGSSADPFYASWIQALWSGVQSGQYAEFELAKQQIKTHEQYIAYETQFIFKKRTNELTLLDVPNTDDTWVLECYCDLTELEYEDHLWVRQYAIAEAKIILGRAYRKFQTLTTPAGETALDGAELVSEGKEEQLVLLENIADYVDGDPTGSFIITG
jgi:hypothetical protein